MSWSWRYVAEEEYTEGKEEIEASVREKSFNLLPIY